MFQYSGKSMSENANSFSAAEVIVAKYPPSASAAALAESHVMPLGTETGL
jgi:hypothetical protein